MKTQRSYPLAAAAARMARPWSAMAANRGLGFSASSAAATCANSVMQETSLSASTAEPIKVTTPTLGEPVRCLRAAAAAATSRSPSTGSRR